MDRLTDIGTIKGILERHGFRFSKALGQHFLINPTVCPRMAQACGLTRADGVLEIGPGFGVLTRELCAQAGKVVAVEVDERLPAVLRETMAGQTNFTLVQGDAMTLDLHELIRREFAGMETCICANLPYYITSPLIMRLLEARLPVRCITVMVQKEAADRLCAAQGSRESGAVTLAVQYYAKAEKLFSVSHGSFMPAPKVDSAVIRLTPLHTPPCHAASEQALFTLIRAAFSQRRKTIANSLTAAGYDKAAIAAACDACSIAHTARAEQLTLEQYAALTHALA